MSYGFTNDDLDLLIDELGLIPSTLLTPTLKEVIMDEFRMREFELSDNEKEYRDHFLKKLRERKNLRRKNNNCQEMTIKINF